MERTAPLNNEALLKLGFIFNGDAWIHAQETKFAVKLEESYFYVSFRGYMAKYPYELEVGILEKQFFERTGRLLY